MAVYERIFYVGIFYQTDMTAIDTLYYLINAWRGARAK